MFIISPNYWWNMCSISIKKIWSHNKLNCKTYRLVSYTSRTKSQNLNVSDLALHLSLGSTSKVSVESRMLPALLQLHPSDQQFDSLPMRHLY